MSGCIESFVDPFGLDVSGLCEFERWLVLWAERSSGRIEMGGVILCLVWSGLVAT